MFRMRMCAKTGCCKGRCFLKTEHRACIVRSSRGIRNAFMPSSTAFRSRTTAKKPSESKQSKAGLTMSVSRIEKKLRGSKSTGARFTKRVSPNASVFATAVVEVVITWILDSMKSVADASPKNVSRLTLTHVIKGVRENKELANALSGFDFVCDDMVDTKKHKTSLAILTQDELRKRKEAMNADAS